MATHVDRSAALEEICNIPRMVRLANELEAVRKQNQTQKGATFFLDCVAYEETSLVEAGKKIWIDAETSDDKKFKISLCTQSPPGFSRLFVKTDDKLPDSPTSTLPYDMVKKSITVEAVASCYNAILMHTSVPSGTFPRFRHKYFLLHNDVPTPKISRLPEMPGPHEINIGLLHHESGHYTVAVLKETMASSMLSGYKKSKLTEGPCVCSFSTSTGKWTCRHVTLPGDLTSWDWDIDVVLANDNSFWWVDLRCGILSYDIDQQHSALEFIPLPSECYQGREIDYHMRENRCVSICNGELKCVHIFRKNGVFFNYVREKQQCEDSVKIWSWRDGNWVKDYEMKFAQLWEGRTYSSVCAPEFVPTYPTIDLHCPSLVNFFLPTGHLFDGCVIGVDLLSMEIKYCGEKYKGLLHDVRGLEIFEFSEAGAKKGQQQAS